MPESSKPLVSIILPTYNRARFLPEAFDSIKSQSFKDWELIIVDDGSTDNTKEIVASFTKEISQDVVYVYQENRGPAAARNKGLEFARGKYIAFYDSDDLWLPHHLEKCVTVLEKNPDVDWIFAACKLIEYPSGRVINPNHLMEIFPKLKKISQLKNGLYIIVKNKSLTRKIFEEDLSIGLQHSIIRKDIFRNFKLNCKFKIGEDKIFLINSIKKGCHFAFFKDVHVIYRIHGENLSLSAKDKALNKKIQKNKEYICALLETKKVLDFQERLFLYRKISGIFFWNIGYLYVNNKEYRKALYYFLQGVRYYPFSAKYIKTIVATIAKSLLDLA